MGRRLQGVVMVGLLLATASAVLVVFDRQAAGQAQRAARTTDGKPNFNGVWQALNEANWDLEAHEARPAAVTQPGVYPYAYARVPAAPVLALGAVGGVPASRGVVEGDGRIPYTPAAAAIKKANAEHWLDRDPEVKCYSPGTPRAMYLPYPFHIVHSTNKILMNFAYADTTRTVHLDKVPDPPVDMSMGHSVGRWEGDTLVVNVSSFTDNNWLDRAGNFHSSAMRLVERFTPISADAIRYEATLEDPSVFTQPWKISMPLYRRLEANAEVLPYGCVEFAEELVYGHLRKQQLVKRWESDTIIMEITRKVPPVDSLYRR